MARDGGVGGVPAVLRFHLAPQLIRVPLLAIITCWLSAPARSAKQRPWIRGVLIAGILAFAFAGDAFAAKRVALVIGNDAYASLPVLKKAVNDARAVASALEAIGFKVLLGENLTRRDTNLILADFDALIGPGDTAFFFFAGHGVALTGGALGGENYLIPTDMPKPRAGEDGLVQDEAHSVDDLVARIRSKGALSSFLVIDACRDNPFAAEGLRSIGTARGLTRVATPSGVFILFSAGIGQTALDGLNDVDPDPNSVFTRKLVPLLGTPGLTHVSLAKRVQQDVSALAATVHHRQEPAYYDQIIGDVVLLSKEESEHPPESTPEGVAIVPETVRDVPAADAAATAYQAAMQQDTVEAWNAFLRHVPDGYYADLGRVRLESLLRAEEERVAAAEAERAEGAKRAEEARLAEEARRAEEQRLAEEATRLAEELRLAALKAEEEPPRPSFNCADARTADERAICDNRELAQLDVLVDDAYRQVRGTARTAANRAANNGREQRGACGSDHDCIARAQVRTIRALIQLGASVDIPDWAPSGGAAPPSDTASGEGPSFNCGKASAADEVAICNSPRLSELDRLVDRGFRSLRQGSRTTANRVARSGLADRQRCGSDVNCIMSAQLDTIREMTQLGAPVEVPSWAQ